MNLRLWSGNYVSHARKLDFWGIQHRYWENKMLNKEFILLGWDCDMKVVNRSEKIKKK